MFTVFGVELLTMVRRTTILSTLWCVHTERDRDK